MFFVSGEVIRKIDAYDEEQAEPCDPFVPATWPDLLDLPNMFCSHIQRTENKTTIFVSTFEVKARAPSLECTTARNGYSDPAYFQDFPLHGKETWIRFRRAKFKCKHCKRTWQETTDQLDQQHRMTTRFRSYVEQKSVQLSFLAASQVCSIDRKRVERVFRSFAERRLRNYATNLPNMPRVLRVQIENIMGRPTLILGDVEARTMFDLVPVSSSQDVARYFDDVYREYVRFLCINPLDAHASDLPRLFENARPVVGKMPLLSLADRIIGKIRRAPNDGVPDHDRSALSKAYAELIGESGNKWPNAEIRILKSLHGQPVLRHAYLLRRQISDLYSLEATAQAEAALDAVARNASIGGTLFVALRRLVEEWRPAILSHFEMDATATRNLDAHDQSMQDVLVGIGGISRGHKFETLRAKLLLRFGKDAGLAFSLPPDRPETWDEILEAFYCNGAPLEDIRRALKNSQFQL